MNTGAVTGYIDVAQLVLYVFWIFFAGLVFYLRREDKREGYPLESDRSGGRVKVQGFPAIPTPKTYVLADGSTVKLPRPERDSRVIRATPTAPYPGAPLRPDGDPMLDAVGPSSYALRAETPDHTIDGEPMIAPLRVLPAFSVYDKGPDPRGMVVLGADRETAGVVHDVWIDRAEPQIRYLEVRIGELQSGARRVLLPITLAKIDASRRIVKVKSILASQFASVPPLANPDQVTRREEDRITAYYAGGNLYALPSRAEPLI
jgi:photosynthetic reaction center H subunit